MVCEPDSLDEENGDATNEDVYMEETKETKPKGHGGCGALQPKYGKNKLFLTGEFKDNKDKEVSWER